MKRTMILWVCTGLLGGVGVLADPHQAWPGYRGNARDGRGLHDQTPPSWLGRAPDVAWKRPVGGAFSQLVVGEGAVLTGDSDPTGEYLVRIDPATGETLWRSPAGRLFKDSFGEGPRSTPTVTGDRVVFLGATGMLVNLRVEDGSQVWGIDLEERFGVPRPRFGWSGSPLVIDDLVVLEIGGDGDNIVALDSKTGELRWTANSGQRTGPAGYGSPMEFVPGEERQILIVVRGTVTGLSLDGKVLWSHPLRAPSLTMPLVVARDRIFVSTSHERGCMMLRVSHGASGYAVDVLWSNREMRNHFNSSVLLGGTIYGFDNATLKAISAETGELIWAHRGLGKGSVTLAGQRLLALGDQGDLVMIDTESRSFVELGRFQALEGRSWTPPTAADGALYLRNLTQMTRVELGPVVP